MTKPWDIDSLYEIAVERAEQAESQLTRLREVATSLLELADPDYGVVDWDHINGIAFTEHLDALRAALTQENPDEG